MNGLGVHSQGEWDPCSWLCTVSTHVYQALGTQVDSLTFPGSLHLSLIDTPDRAQSRLPTWIC